ncbi:MAG: BACON domain-containing protein [Syntrophales bacterium]
MKHRGVIGAILVAACLWVGGGSAFAGTVPPTWRTSLTWETSIADALTLARAQGKRILLIGGDDTCDKTKGVIEELIEAPTPKHPEYPPIRNLVAGSFIPWYGNNGYSFNDWANIYAKGMNGLAMPLICVIDPNNSGTCLARTNGPQADVPAFYTWLSQYATSTSSCTVNISPSGVASPASGNTGSISVTSSSSCSWTAVSNAPSWITIAAGSASGTGNKTVAYSVAANATGVGRTGTITIGGRTFTVTQNGSTGTCAYTISPASSPLFDSAPHYSAFGDLVGDKGTVDVVTSPGCAWSVTGKPSWVTITAGNPGNGSGTVNYTVAANTGIARNGTMTIAGQTFTVTQEGTCASTISPTSASFSSLGQTGTVAVTTTGSCTWSAAGNDTWITVTAGSTGTGNGSVAYSVAANTTGSARTGTMTIGGQTFTVTQEGAVNNTLLYFPHVDTSLPWQTEIALVNTSDQQITGTLRALSDVGDPVGTALPLILAAHGRKQITVADQFTSHTDIGYITFETNSTAVLGYTKLYQTGIYRGAVPAARATNAAEIYIPHIASDDQWWTGVSLVNTTSATKDLTITFNNGEIRQITLTKNQHRFFGIAEEFFGNQPQPGIQSAVITNAGGVIGLAFFGNTVGGSQMDGIPLSGNTASTIYYPDVAGSDWWTGIVAYNPSASGGTITITPYDKQGTSLSPTPITRNLGAKEKCVGTPASLGLPAQTAWFKIDSALPLTGFELFGTVNNNRLAAYAGGGGTGSKTGVFPKIEKNGGRTSIFLVNTEDSPASVTLTAYSDIGTPVGTPVLLAVGGHAKVADRVENIFVGQDISGATYIAYSSDRTVVGFQLNGSSDDTMVDGLPGLSGAN